MEWTVGCTAGGTMCSRFFCPSLALSDFQESPLSQVGLLEVANIQSAFMKLIRKIFVGYHHNPPTPEVVSPKFDSLMKKGLELDQYVLTLQGIFRVSASSRVGGNT